MWTCCSCTRPRRRRASSPTGTRRHGGRSCTTASSIAGAGRRSGPNPRRRVARGSLRENRRRRPPVSVSRGDSSGTHYREIALWRAAGGGPRPGGPGPGRGGSGTGVPSRGLVHRVGDRDRRRPCTWRRNGPRTPSPTRRPSPSLPTCSPWRRSLSAIRRCETSIPCSRRGPRRHPAAPPCSRNGSPPRTGGARSRSFGCGGGTAPSSCRFRRRRLKEVRPPPQIPPVDPLLEALRLITSGDLYVWNVIVRSLQISGSALLVAMVIGLPIGIAVGLTRFRLRLPVVAVINAGLAFPPVVVGLVVFLLLSRAGPLGDLRLLYSPGAMIAAQAVIAGPYIAAVSLAAVRGHPARHRAPGAGARGKPPPSHPPAAARGCARRSWRRSRRGSGRSSARWGR